jgi:hypothetical protein
MRKNGCQSWPSSIQMIWEIGWGEFWQKFMMAVKFAHLTTGSKDGN